MTHRLNARIDDELARKIEALKERTGGTVTDIVKASVEQYYESVVSKGSAHEILERVGFIGTAAGPTDLAANYKAYLTQSMARKHGR